MLFTKILLSSFFVIAIYADYVDECKEFCSLVDCPIPGCISAERAEQDKKDGKCVCCPICEDKLLKCRKVCELVRCFTCESREQAEEDRKNGRCTCCPICPSKRVDCTTVKCGLPQGCNLETHYIQYPDMICDCCPRCLPKPVRVQYK